MGLLEGEPPHRVAVDAKRTPLVGVKPNDLLPGSAKATSAAEPAATSATLLRLGLFGRRGLGGRPVANGRADQRAQTAAAFGRRGQNFRSRRDLLCKAGTNLFVALRLFFLHLFLHGLLQAEQLVQNRERGRGGSTAGGRVGRRCCSRARARHRGNAARKKTKLEQRRTSPSSRDQAGSTLSPDDYERTVSLENPDLSSRSRPPHKNQHCNVSKRF